MGMPALPHPAANRLVQSAFLIGCAMRKALSISQAPSRNSMLLFDIRQMARVMPISQAPSRNMMVRPTIRQKIGLF
jgi:hypothetical protein